MSWSNTLLLDKCKKHVKIPPCFFFIDILNGRNLYSFNFTFILEFSLPCTEDVPTCGDSCDKDLECGIHRCSQRCHRGACEICRQVRIFFPFMFFWIDLQSFILKGLLSVYIPEALHSFSFTHPLLTESRNFLSPLFLGVNQEASTSCSF